MAESLKEYCRECNEAIVKLYTEKNNKKLPILWSSLEEDERQSCLLGIIIPIRKGHKNDGSPLHVPHFHKHKKKSWEF